jgi:hypothetical protein
MSKRLLRIPPQYEALISASGSDIVKKLGRHTFEDVLADVLVGKNVRAATEPLTRRRLSLLAGALWLELLSKQQEDKGFLGTLPDLAAAQLKQRGVEAPERAMLQWSIGLTNKQVQNVLRSDAAGLNEYVASLKEVWSEAAKDLGTHYGPLQKLGVPFDWPTLISLLTATGAATLSIRGSEKSMYGKFFERLVLVGLLHSLGLEFQEAESGKPMSFWLASANEKRESDATILLSPGVGVRIDIGFIGPGNSEISLDKVSRFEREAEIAGKHYTMKTLIIVDRIGDRSNIKQLAERIDGKIVQMSGAYWPLDVGAELEQVDKRYSSPFKGLKGGALGKAIRATLSTAPLDKVMPLGDAAQED